MIIANISFTSRDFKIFKCENSNNFDLNLKTKMMKKVYLILVMFAVVKIGNAQVQYNNVKNNSLYYNDQMDYVNSVTYKIGGGVLIPQGNLKSYFGISPLLELSLDFPVSKKKSMEVALQFVVPDQKESFQYDRAIDTVQAKATYIINPMVRFKKNVSKSMHSKLHIGLGIGLSIINTNARNPFYNGNEDDSEKYEILTTLLVSPSLDYVKKFKNNDELTFSFGLNYSPYKIEGALQEDIGAISLSPRILYSF